MTTTDDSVFNVDKIKTKEEFVAGVATASNYPQDDSDGEINDFSSTQLQDAADGNTDSSEQEMEGEPDMDSFKMDVPSECAKKKEVYLPSICVKREPEHGIENVKLTRELIPFLAETTDNLSDTLQTMKAERNARAEVFDRGDSSENNGSFSRSPVGNAPNSIKISVSIIDRGSCKETSGNHGLSFVCSASVPENSGDCTFHGGESDDESEEHSSSLICAESVSKKSSDCTNDHGEIDESKGSTQSFVASVPQIGRTSTTYCGESRNERRDHSLSQIRAASVTKRSSDCTIDHGAITKSEGSTAFSVASAPKISRNCTTYCGGIKDHTPSQICAASVSKKSKDFTIHHGGTKESENFAPSSVASIPKKSSACKIYCGENNNMSKDHSSSSICSSTIPKISNDCITFRTASKIGSKDHSSSSVRSASVSNKSGSPTIHGGDNNNLIQGFEPPPASSVPKTSKFSLELGTHSGIQLGRVSVQLEDIFLGNPKKFGKSHSFDGSCSCIFCRGGSNISDLFPEKPNGSRAPKRVAEKAVPKECGAGGVRSEKMSTKREGENFEEAQDTFGNDGSIKRVQLGNTRPFRCEICGADFSKQQELKIHSITHENGSLTKKTLSNGEQGASEIRLERLSTTGEDAAPDTFQREHPVERMQLNTTFKCEVCREEFPQQQELKIHSITHENGSLATDTLPRVEKGTEQDRSEIPSTSEDEVDATPRNGKPHPENDRSLEKMRLRNTKHKCEVCGQNFPQQQELKVHSVTHSKRPENVQLLRRTVTDVLKCRICSQIFHFKRDMERHLTAHGIERRFSCDFCPAKFKRGHHARDHMETVHRGKGHFRCELCSAAFKQRGMLTKHLKHVHDKSDGLFNVVQCDINPSSSKDEKNSKRHVANTPWNCNICGGQFRTRDLLSEHKRLHKNYGPFKCALCPAKFKDKFRLTARKKLHDKRCSRGSKEFQKSGLVQHSKFHASKRPFKCERCSASFKNNSHLKRHLVVHTHLRPWKCGVCGKQYKRKDGLTSHLKSHDDRPFKCDKCLEKFKHRLQLQAHKRLHDDERRYQCEECSKIFHTRKALVKHLKVHSEERPFKCGQCSASFKRTNNLKSHMAIHTTLRPWKCGVCKGQFKRKNALKKHLLSHEDRKRPFQYDLCPATFKFRKNLTSHQKIQGHEGRFQCAQCLKKFKEKNLLTRHRIADCARPFVCKLCGVTFELAEDLKVHVANLHKSSETEREQRSAEFKGESSESNRQVGHSAERLQTGGSSEDAKEVDHCAVIHLQSAHSGGNLLKCPLCSVTFRRILALKGHLRSTHGSNGSNECKLCSKKFVSPADLKMHMAFHDATKFCCGPCALKFESDATYEEHMKAHKE